MKVKLRHTFATLDRRVKRHARTVHNDGGLLPRFPIELRLVGQLALILAELPFPVAGTTDVDVLGLEVHWISTQLQALLLELGLILEPDHHLIWMPPETHYDAWFQGEYLHVALARPIYIIASKCKFQRTKDRFLIRDYFARYPQAQHEVEHMGIGTQWIQ